MSSVFSIELDGISKACSAKVMMNRPVTIMMAIEAMNSEVVSFGFAAFCASAAFRAFCGAVFTEFLVVAKCVLPWNRVAACQSSLCGFHVKRLTFPNGLNQIGRA